MGETGDVGGYGSIDAVRWFGSRRTFAAALIPKNYEIMKNDRMVQVAPDVRSSPDLQKNMKSSE
jgi:hypothetical protein